MAVLYHVLGGGQSNAVSSGAIPALSTTQLFSNVMLTPLAKAAGSSGIRMPQDRLVGTGEMTTIIPLVETSTQENLNTLDAFNIYTATLVSSGNYGESIGSSMLGYLATHVPGFVGMYSVGARGGCTYAQLAYGDVYQNMLQPLRSAHAIYLANGYSAHKCLAVAIQHGEANFNDVNYAVDLNQWIANVNADVKSITGQSEDIFFIMVQVSQESVRTSGLQQLLATLQNPKILIATPTYNLPSSSDHRTNIGHQICGGFMGKVYKRVVTDGLNWTGLRPQMITMSGSVITIKCSVPVPPLQAITSRFWGAIANYGFEYSDDSSSISIVSVSFSGNDILLQMSGSQNGANPRVAYACLQQYGNVFDSDPAVGIQAEPLQNPMQHFDYPVNFGVPCTADPIIDA